MLAPSTPSPSDAEIRSAVRLLCRRMTEDILVELADGQLDDDPAAKAEAEELVRTDPEASAFLEDYRKGSGAWSDGEIAAIRASCAPEQWRAEAEALKTFMADFRQRVAFRVETAEAAPSFDGDEESTTNVVPSREDWRRAQQAYAKQQKIAEAMAPPHSDAPGCQHDQAISGQRIDEVHRRREDWRGTEVHTSNRRFPSSISAIRPRLIGNLALTAAVLLAGIVIALWVKFGAKLPAGAVESQDMEERIDLNAPNADGQTLLQLAVAQRDAAVVKRLVELGANVDLPDRQGVTPIMLAAAQGDMELLREFSARSQNPRALDTAGRTAAHYALLAGQAEALEFLLPCVRDLDRPIADGRNLLTIAAESGKPELIRPVLAIAPSNLEWNRDTRAVLNLALQSKNTDLLRLVLSKHPAPPTREGGTTTPLLAKAIASDDAELFNALLAAGADPNTVIPAPAEKHFVSLIKSEHMRECVRADEGTTVLMIAAGLGKIEYVRALLDAGAERNQMTKRHKMLALYFAARSGKWKCTQTLLGSGPTPDELRIEVSLAAQKASVIKHGVPVLKTIISTGREGFNTPTGEYVITDKNRDYRSSIYEVPMPYFMRLNCGDFGMHAGALSRYPASHGNIRLPPHVAQKLYSEIPVGTVVKIN